MGGLGAFLICIPVIWSIYRGDKYSATSYFLWSIMSVVVTVVLIRAREGGYTIMAGYVLSDFSIGLYVYLKDKTVTFGYFEAMVAVLTLMCLCMYVWSERRKRFRPAIVMCAIAAIVAGIPQIFYSFAHPFSTSLTICFLYIIVSALSYYGDKPTFEARLIPALSIVYWMVIIFGVINYRMV
jgi:hypothetical protein